MENPIKMDDLGVPPLKETPNYGIMRYQNKTHKWTDKVRHAPPLFAGKEPPTGKSEFPSSSTALNASLSSPYEFDLGMSFLK